MGELVVLFFNPSFIANSSSQMRCCYSNKYEQDRFHAQLSLAWKRFCSFKILAGKLLRLFVTNGLELFILFIPSAVPLASNKIPKLAMVACIWLERMKC